MVIFFYEFVNSDSAVLISIMLYVYKKAKVKQSNTLVLGIDSNLSLSRSVLFLSFCSFCFFRIVCFLL